MARLSVNINKFATLRNARGANQPCLIDVTKDIIKFGATSITLHPRPDERHIKRQDAFEVAELLKQQAYKGIEYNIEGFPSADFMALIMEIRPSQCTLVPDPPEALTSSEGWKLPQATEGLRPILEQLREAGVRSSLFVDPQSIDKSFLDALDSLKPDRVELYTEQYAKDFLTENNVNTSRLYKMAAEQILNLGIDINAGHDLSLDNLGNLLEYIPQCKEVSIGHALVCESLYMGLQNCIRAYLNVATDKQ